MGKPAARVVSWLQSYLELLLLALKAVGVAVVVWVAGWFIGRAVRYVIVKLLGKTDFDEWVRKVGVGRAIRRTGYRAHEFVGAATGWLVFIVFIFVGLYASGLVAGWVELSEFAQIVIVTYIGGFMKLTLIVLVGFMLVDAFVSYIYRSTELKSELEVLYPLTEYLRISLYMAIVVFAVEQSGLGVETLSRLLLPIIWGITAIVALFMVYLIIQRTRTRV